jgi:regulatory protein
MNHEVAAKLAKYCAYQERCTMDLKVKLDNMNVEDEEQEEIISYLKKNKFIDNRRFALTFAESKFRNKKWGKVKIRFHLEQKEITEKDICDALDSIPEEEYLDLFHTLVAQKSKTISAANEYNKNHKIAQYLISKGFEQDLIWQYLRV